MIDMLAELGRDLRRPRADYLRDGIYELRTQFGGLNYRVLYFFHNDCIAVVSHGLTKEAEVPTREINLAIRRKAVFESDPEKYRHEE